MLFCTWKYQPTVQICRPSHSLFHISHHSCKLQNNRKKATADIRVAGVRRVMK